MNLPHRATATDATSSSASSSRLWRDTPKAKAYFQVWGKTWGGKDGLIAQAAQQAKGQ